MKISVSVKLSKIERALVVLAGLTAIFILLYAVGNMPSREDLFSCETISNIATGDDKIAETINETLNNCQDQIISAIIINYKIAFILRLFVYWTFGVFITLSTFILVKWINKE